MQIASFQSLQQRERRWTYWRWRQRCWCIRQRELLYLSREVYALVTQSIR